MAGLLLRLHKLTGRADYLRAAEETMAVAVDLMTRAPTAAAQMLMAVDFHAGSTREIVLAGRLGEPATERLLADWRQRFLPRHVFAFVDATGDTPATGPLADLLSGKSGPHDQPTCYVCEGFTCQSPIVGEDAICRKE